MKKSKYLLLSILIIIITVLSILFLKPNKKLEVTITGIPELWINQDAVITIHQKDSLYSFNGSEYTDQNTFIVENNGEVKVSTKSSTGEITEKIIIVDKIDKEEPTVKSVKTNLYEKETEKYFEIEAEDISSGIKEYGYYLNEKLYTSLTNKVTITDEINETFKLIVIDNAGNIKEIDPLLYTKTNNKFNIIKSTNKLTNKDLKLTITSNIDLKEYSFNNEPYTTDNTYTIKENGTYTVKVKDKLNKVYTQKITITNIDKTKPQLTITKELNNNQLLIKLSSSDTNKIKDCYSWNYGEFTNINTQVFTQNIKDYIIRVRDQAGNITTEKIDITEIVIQELPKEKVTFQVEKSTTEITNQSVKITVNTKSTNLVSFNNGPFNTTKTIVIDQNVSNYSIKVKNEFETKEEIININNIDKTSPKLTITRKPNDEQLLITLEVNDENKIKDCYSWNYGEFTNNNTQVFTQNVNDYVIKVRDKAGNITTEKINITEIVKKEKVTFQIERNITELTNQSVRITVNTKSTNLVSFNNEPFSTIKTILIDENVNNYSVKVKNEFETKEEIINITNIDKVKPVLNYSQNITEKTKENVIITLTSEDDRSLPENKYSYNKAAFTSENTYTFTNNVSSFSIRVKDTAGNITEKIISITNIDKEKTIEEKNADLVSEIKTKYGFDVLYGEGTYFWFNGSSCTILTDETKANTALTKLKKALTLFPNDFFKKFQGQNGYSVLLMDDIPGDVAGVASPEMPGSNELVIDVNTSLFERTFYHETFHMIEYYINWIYYGKEDQIPFNDWKTLNPSIFNYTNRDDSDNTLSVYDYDVTPMERVFVGGYSKKNEREDRAEIFADLMFRPYKREYMTPTYGIYKKELKIVNILNSIWTNNTNAGWNRYIP